MVVTDRPDLYALLQVSPTASEEEINAAYQRLATLYSAERLQGGPAEFQQLGAQRREELAAAYAVLSDPEQRAAYDQSRAPQPATAVLDFRPLPPARRRERPSPSIPLPPVPTVPRARTARGPRSLLMPLLVGGAALGVLLLLVLSSVRVQSGATALATPGIPNLVLPFTEAQVRDARARAEASNDPEAWVALGNVLYDNIETLRERAPLSPQYQGALPQWLEVTEAYSRALELGAGPVARADLAIAHFYYGIGTNQPQAIDQGVLEAERALASGPDEPRVLLNYGLIMAGLNPPREREALDAWRRLVAVAPQTFEAQRAQTLIASYGQ